MCIFIPNVLKHGRNNECQYNTLCRREYMYSKVYICVIQISAPGCLVYINIKCIHTSRETCCIFVDDSREESQSVCYMYTNIIYGRFMVSVQGRRTQNAVTNCRNDESVPEERTVN